MRYDYYWAILDSNNLFSKKPQPLDNKEPIIKTDDCQKSQEVQNQVHILTIYPEIAEIIAAWPNLPEDIKRQIKALIEQGKNRD